MTKITDTYSITPCFNECSVHFSRRTSGIAAMTAAGILWGTSGTVSRFIPASASPLTIAWIRLMITGILLICAEVSLHRHSQKKFAFLKSRNAFLAGICMMMNQAGFFLAMDFLSVGTATMLVIGSALIFSGIADWFSGESPSRSWLCAAVFGTIGCILTAFDKTGRINIP